VGSKQEAAIPRAIKHNRRSVM